LFFIGIKEFELLTSEEYAISIRVGYQTYTMWAY